MSAAVQRYRGVHPPGRSHELSNSQVLDVWKSLRLQQDHIWLVNGRDCEFKMKLRVVSECCCNHCKCNYLKILGHELGEAAG